MAVHKRTRNGCFTCRRRKKKCDESSYPQCQNCHTNKLECSWPPHVKEKHDKASDAGSESSPIKTAADSLTAASSKVQKTDTKKRSRNYILERIAMQQDCVEENPDDFVLDIKYGKRSDIRQRIAHQMDIPGDHFPA